MLQFFTIKSIMTVETKLDELRRKVDEHRLTLAIKNGILPEGSSLEDLKPDVLQEMANKELPLTIFSIESEETD
ncbi:hypothetical protein HY008_02305 [Candidatus Woesebacteria bacterium]|nr:hypothetical protein [Candidatus Woesebacteria bacterium]